MRAGVLEGGISIGGITLISTAVTAELARDGFFSRVRVNVASEITLSSKAVTAELAREGFLSRVGPHVGSETTLISTSVTAEFTRECFPTDTICSRRRRYAPTPSCRPLLRLILFSSHHA